MTQASPSHDHPTRAREELLALHGREPAITGLLLENAAQRHLTALELRAERDGLGVYKFPPDDAEAELTGRCDELQVVQVGGGRLQYRFRRSGGPSQELAGRDVALAMLATRPDGRAPARTGAA